MNSFVLMLPFLGIRFFLFSYLNKEALGKAQEFAPRLENEKMAFYLYQISTIVLLFFPLTLKIKPQPILSLVGSIIYGLGLLILLLTIINFSAKKASALKTEGIYRLSRNPMYVAYFIIFSSCVIFTQSRVLFISLLIFQLSSHWIILSEERWCREMFGAEYLAYAKKVRRYI